jgi:hypothetical protein
MGKVFEFLTFCVLLTLSFAQTLNGKPNIVIIMADDMVCGANQVIQRRIISPISPPGII